MTSRPDLKRLLLIALGIVAAWVALGLFLASQHHAQVEASHGSDDLGQRQIATIAGMLVWAVFTPIVIFIADRLPLRAPVRLRNAAVLVPFVLAIAAVRSLFDASLPMFLEGVATDGPVDPRHYAWSAAHTHVLFAVLLIAIANYLRLQRDIGERRRDEARFQAELANARLRRLRADIHPHFLFNALNAVAALVHADASKADRMLGALGELLRRSVASQDAMEVTIAEELDFLEKYLDVQRTRFGDRLRTKIVVTDESLLGAAIAPLLLQPLVENAIIHGIGQKRDGGSVSVRVTGDAAWLRIEIRDDGPGADPAQIFGRGSVGVPNVKARLEYLYGDAQSLTFRRDGNTFLSEVVIPRRSPLMQKVAS